MSANHLYKLFFILAATASGLAACNTTRGLGQDVEATGDAIEEAAEETEDEIG